MDKDKFDNLDETEGLLAPENSAAESENDGQGAVLSAMPEDAVKESKVENAETTENHENDINVADDEKVKDAVSEVSGANADAKVIHNEPALSEEQKKNLQRAQAMIGVKTVGKSLLLKLKDSVFSVLPISIIVIILCVTPIASGTISTREIVTFAVSSIFLILGIGLFNLGADMAMTPMGEHIGSGLTKSRNLTLLLIVGFVMGLLITIAEPDLTVLGGYVSEVMNKTVLIVVVGVGVGLFLLFAIIKVVFKANLSFMLVLFYMILFAIMAIMIESGKGNLLPLAFDSGGVTTGPITVPFIMSLGVGVAATIGGRNAKENSFGLIALCSIGPMIAVAVLSFFMKGEINLGVQNYEIGENLGAEFLTTLGNSAKDISIALALIVGFFLILQIFVLKLPRRRILQIGVGIAYTFFGLLVFFTAEHIGFMPIGFKLGQALANFNKPLLVVISFVLGFVVVLAEPAVHVLNGQVEQVTDGRISRRAMLIALAIGVGLSIGLSVLRIVLDFSILYYLVPGYIISLGLSLFVPKMYTAIAFDSGGVASGPMTASFVLPFAMGACSVLAGNKVLELAFGIVAMVAMTPLITIQLLGFRAIAAAKVRHSMNIKRIVDADDEQIIEFM